MIKGIFTMDIKPIAGENDIQETANTKRKEYMPSYLSKCEPDTFELTTKTESKKGKNLIEQIKDFCTSKDNASNNKEEKALEDIENSVKIETENEDNLVEHDPQYPSPANHAEDSGHSPINPSPYYSSPANATEYYRYKSPIDTDPHYAAPDKEPNDGFRQI